MSVRDLIDAIASGDSQTTQTAFESEMMSRVAARMDQMRQDVAKNMFKTEESVVVEEEVELSEEQISEMMDTLSEEEIDEATMSAKAGRAGKDLGAPGKNFEKIANAAAKRYGSKEAGQRVAGAILKKMRAEEAELEEAAPAGEQKGPKSNELHVQHVGGGKYKVHAVGKNFAHGIKAGEHLSDTELDDFSEMGGKIKHVK